MINQTEWTQQKLEEMIANGAEESVYLDFKASGALEKDKKKDICKDVSAFANSDGGVIIYGMNEVDHKADSFSFIDGDVYTKEWLEQVIKDGIQRRIDGIRIHPVRIDNDVKKTLYVVEIPVSELAPHMTKDNKYYKRFNFMSVAMEEYEVRHTFERRQNSKLEIVNVLSELVNGNICLQEGLFRLNIACHIRNVGHAVADEYKLKALLTGVKGCSYSYDVHDGYNLLKSLNGETSISTTQSIPIYPDEEVCVLNFRLEIPIHLRHVVVKEAIVHLTLFHQAIRIEESFEPGASIDRLINKRFKADNSLDIKD